MSEETIVHTGESMGLPYSKGVMAQSLTASGLSPQRAYGLAVLIERRLDERGEGGIDVDGLRALAREVLREEEGDEAVRRYRDAERIDHLERPLIVLLAGTTGVGKSTLATMLASRLGITRVIPTDVIRQVLRAFFSHDFMPAVHYSAFEAGEAVELVADEEADQDLVGFARQAESVGTGVAAIVERACRERTPMVLEGVHLVPGLLEEELRRRCLPVEAVVAVGDEDLHRGHFHMRAADRPAERYLEHFEQIRKLQDYLLVQAGEEGVAVIENVNIDEALARVMDLVLDTVGRAAPGEED